MFSVSLQSTYLDPIYIIPTLCFGYQNIDKDIEDRVLNASIYYISIRFLIFNLTVRREQWTLY